MITYIGQKYKLINFIKKEIPDNISTYVEVFGGVMDLYLRSNIKFNSVIYNDKNFFYTIYFLILNMILKIFITY